MASEETAKVMVNRQIVNPFLHFPIDSALCM